MRALLRVSMLTCALLAGVGVDSARAGANESWLDEQFDVVVRDQRLNDVLRQFGSMVGSPVYVSEQVRAQVSARFEGASGREILDALAREHSLDWRFDGRRIEITSQSEQVSRLLDLNGVKRARLVNVLDGLDLFDERYPISAVDGTLAYMTAPPRYIAAVEAVLADLIDQQAREAKDREIQAEAARLEAERQAEAQAKAQLNAEKRAAQLRAEEAADRRHAEELAEQRRAQQALERRHAEQLAEKRRAEQAAERRRLQDLAEARRKEALVDARRREAAAERRRAEARAEQQRLLEEARRNAEKRNAPTRPLIIRGGVWGG